ncbi:MAG TPA: LytTR family DNA-binding domain-containing protein [Phenylobacterium sp.]|nr:LytTR family DNA-binding domain-containing protein [Phenylobacterium sp.]
MAVDVFTVVDDRANAGHPVPAWEAAVWEVSSGVVLAALAPAVLWIVRRVRPSPPPRFGWLAWHVPAALVFSLVHVLSMGVLRWATYAAIGASYDPLAPLADWPYELRKDLLVYVGLVAGYLTWRGAEPAPAIAGGACDPIEVRDGARRLFVPVEDILWVEAAGNYVELHRRSSPVLHRAPLAEMERRLAASGFVRIHRSRLVRRAAIAAVETRTSGDFSVRLVTGETLAGSRRFRSATRLDRGAAHD